MTKRITEREQSIMGRIFFIFKVNTVEEGPFPIRRRVYKTDRKKNRQKVDIYCMDFFTMCAFGVLSMVKLEPMIPFVTF